MDYYFGEWYESGLSDLHVSEDEEIEESLFPPHPTFAAPLVVSAFKIRSEACGGVFRENSHCV